MKVKSLMGQLFLRAINFSIKCNYATFQFEIFQDAIKNVGANNVVVVVIDAKVVCR